MLFVLILMAAIWGIGALMQAPVRARLTMIGALYVGVILVNLTLPVGSAPREATGGSAGPWVLLGVFVALGLGYRQGLRRLRERLGPAAPVQPARPARPDTMGEAELARYARQILLREVGGEGQKRLRAARVLVVGAGGLGSPALMYLGAAGVGTLGVIDGDVVEASNLQRQIIHAEDRLGMPKVFSAQAALAALNPFVEVRPYNRALTEEIAEALFADYDLILDGSDNFDTRALVNRAAVATGRPLVSAAIAQWEGQIGVYHPAAGGPCLACVFPERPAEGLVPSCAEAGVVAPLPGVLGAMMAAEAIKLVTGAGRSLGGRLLLYDALEGESRTLRCARRADCAVCGGVAAEDPELGAGEAVARRSASA
ncbi:MAG: HesA/MoeB/ThiF family protein [Alkalilacustris sp.]